MTMKSKTSIRSVRPSAGTEAPLTNAEKAARAKPHLVRSAAVAAVARGENEWRAPSTEERGRLAGMVTRLFEHWQLPEAQQLQLLGLHPTSRGTLREYRLGKPLPTTRDVLDRVGNLLAMHQSLRLLFPENRDVVAYWISAVNRDFGDRSPLAVMLHDGIRGLLNVRGYLDEWRAI